MRGTDIARFLSRLAAAEAGALGCVPELRELVATSDALAEFLSERDDLALRFDRVVAVAKADRAKRFEMRPGDVRVLSRGETEARP